VIILGIAFAFVLSVPLVSYVIVFWNGSISDDPNNWGVLGDFVGGVLNPIISLASLCILSYLTYLVSLQNVKESKKLLLLEKRMDAYQDLTKYIKEINKITDNITKINGSFGFCQ
jgi:hypothetical protein